jgi:hypothetical protein
VQRVNSIVQFNSGNINLSFKNEGHPKYILPFIKKGWQRKLVQLDAEWTGIMADMTDFAAAPNSAPAQPSAEELDAELREKLCPWDTLDVKREFSYVEPFFRQTHQTAESLLFLEGKLYDEVRELFGQLEVADDVIVDTQDNAAKCERIHDVLAAAARCV